MLSFKSFIFLLLRQPWNMALKLCIKLVVNQRIISTILVLLLEDKGLGWQDRWRGNINFLIPSL